MTQLRPFRFWEQICSTMNISLAFELQGPVTADLIARAWALIKQECPYFASTIVQDEYGQLYFKSPTPLQGSQHLGNEDAVEWIRHSGHIDFAGLLVKFANTQRDHTQSLATLQLHSSGSINHLLLATINHAGIDGISLFNVFRSFFSKLGELAYGFDPQPEDIKQNVDIGARVPPVDATKLQPVQLPHDFMPMLIPVQDAPEGAVPYIEAEFGELTASETARLVAKCREQGTTVQAALSAASAIAMVQAQKGTRPLPQTLLLQCPANMRRQVKPAFNDDEPSCAASFLWWQQPVSGQQSLWDLVRSCTANIRKESEEFGGLAFWARLLASKTLPEIAAAPQPPYTPPYTITSSSVGINPIASENGPIKILRTHMMLSTFGITSPTEAGTMTHAHTFGKRLHVTLTYSMPAVGHKRGRAMAATQMAVLQVLASDNADVLVGDFLAS